MTASRSVLIARIRAVLEEKEAWARAASRPYPYADAGAAVPEGGVRWRWVTGDNWDTAKPEPAVDEFLADGARCQLATVQEWPSTSRHSQSGRSHTVQMPETYFSAEEVDPAAAGHIERNGPAEVLATVQAHRAILQLYCNAASAVASRSEYTPLRSQIQDEAAVDVLWAAVAAIAGIYFPDEKHIDEP